ncbi:c17.1 [Ichnoviriform fugitivi]|uniref:C17.1 n=1 Tax=Ichnoviriform fugitivi TaxID=265522 RepID=A2Q0I0_9VIRU|nr:c17.1 [Ichnoviriform fugitivi]BAF45695.1 c17.1 [Ichnoviriform fugitivi]
MPETSEFTTTEPSVSSDSGNTSGSDTKQNGDGDFGTSTVGSENRLSSYGGSTSSEGMPKTSQSTTTELSASSDSGNTSESVTEQNADGDFRTSTVGPENRLSSYGGSTSSEGMPKTSQSTTTELSASSDSGNTSESVTEQNADGDFRTSTVGPEDRLSGYRSSMSSKSTSEENDSTTTEVSTSTDSENASTSDTKQIADEDFGTSTVGTEDHLSGYRSSTSSKGMSEVNASTTTELSTTTDSENASTSDAKQNADGDFARSTVGSGDHSWEYEDSTSSEPVPELNRTATTRSPTSSDAASAGSLFILYFVVFVCFICICLSTFIPICVYINKKRNFIKNSDMEMKTPHELCT